MLAAIEEFRPGYWERLMKAARWLWLPGMAAIVYGLHLGDGGILTVAACVWQLPLIAFGMATLLVCAVSSRLPFCRIDIPGAAFIASVAYSVYLSHKLIIHSVTKFCATGQIALNSIPALFLVEGAIFLAGAILFFAVERPFLLLRHRIASR